MKPRKLPAVGPPSTRVEPSAKYHWVLGAFTPRASWAPFTSPMSKPLMKYMGRSATKLALEVSRAATPVKGRPTTSKTETVVRWPAGTTIVCDFPGWGTPAGCSSW